MSRKTKTFIGLSVHQMPLIRPRDELRKSKIYRANRFALETF